MSATFWNMRRRLAAQAAVKPVEKPDEKPKETAEKPKKGKVNKDGK